MGQKTLARDYDSSLDWSYGGTSRVAMAVTHAAREMEDAKQWSLFSAVGRVFRQRGVPW